MLKYWLIYLFSNIILCRTNSSSFKIHACTLLQKKYGEITNYDDVDGNVDDDRSEDGNDKDNADLDQDPMVWSLIW